MDDRPGFRRGRLDADGPPDDGERFTELVRVGDVVVESIVSSATPDGGVQRQAHDEWVVVLDGSAVLDVDGERVELRSGEWVLIPAGVAHRVTRTEHGTRWLAVHVHPAVPGGANLS